MYGSITVHMEAIDCVEGVRIFYGPLHCRDVLPPKQEEMLFGPLKAQQIQLTPRHPAPYAKEVFNTVKRGLILEVCRAHKHNMCAHTHTHTRMHTHIQHPLLSPRRLKTAASMPRLCAVLSSTTVQLQSDTPEPSQRKNEQKSLTTRIDFYHP